MRLEGLAAPREGILVPAFPGDVVRLEKEGFWLYCQVDERLPNGDLLCRIVDAQSWPAIMTEGIRPGVGYAVAPANVLSVLATGTGA